MNTDLPKCIIVDMDGTLAKRRKGVSERSPYDWERVGEDRPNWPVIKLVQILKQTGEYSISILSGRDEKARQLTEDWLRQYGVTYDWLFMRPSGNNQKDCLFKCRIYINEILPHYEVEFVLDDRDQVVAFWRSIGLTCFQVDYGDF